MLHMENTEQRGTGSEGRNGQMERSFSIGPFQPRKVVHWCLETFPFGPNSSIQF